MERVHPGTHVAVGGKLLGSVHLAEGGNGPLESLSVASSSHVCSQAREMYHVSGAVIPTAS
jgi:hypothetical protein